MKKKAVLSFFCACLMLFLLASTALAAQESVTTGDWGENATWSYDDSTKTLTITGEGSIGGYYFYDEENVETVSLQGNITEIRYDAFDYFTSLTKIDIPNSVTSIGDGAFEGCTSLTEIVIPDGVTSIGEFAFAGCTSLKHVVIPASVTTFSSRIGRAFAGCPLMTAGPTGSGCNIEFGWTDAIPAYAFHGCGNLTEIEIPDGVASIGEHAFEGCENLTSIRFPETLQSIGDAAFASTGFSEVELPDSVKLVGDSAFAGCDSLTRAVIPASVLRIGSSTGGEHTVFSRCDHLNEISVSAENKIYASQDGALLNKEKSTLLYCPPGKTTYSIPNGVTTIGAFAFYISSGRYYYELDDSDVSNLESVSIPNSVTGIEAYAFACCAKLTNLTLPNGVTTIDDGAFANCAGLTELSIPNSVTTIGNYAFCGCAGLTELSIPDSVTSFYHPDFDGCTALTEVTLPGTLFNNYRGYGISGPSLTTVRITEGAECLSGTFSELPTLTTVYLPASLKEIGPDTFMNCINLQTVTFAGTQGQWDTMAIADGNQELSLATIVCTGTGTDTPDTPDTPDTLDITAVPGGLGRRLTVEVESGHWLTIQTRRAGSISISAIQAPAGAGGMVTVNFSAPSGSIVQVWETEEELAFVDGVPTNPILKTVVREL